MVAKNTLIGAAPAMIELYKRIAQVAPTEVTVLIVGEKGSGKQLVARTLHERSGRASRPFGWVNCAGLAEETLEGRLFGEGQPGVFEEANAVPFFWMKSAAFRWRFKGGCCGFCGTARCAASMAGRRYGWMPESSLPAIGS